MRQSIQEWNKQNVRSTVFKKLEVMRRRKQEREENNGIKMR